MNKVQVRLSEVLSLLEQGKGRQEIAEHFGLSLAEIKNIFEHPKLKGRRPKKVKEESFNLVDDTATPLDLGSNTGSVNYDSESTNDVAQQVLEEVGQEE